MDKVRVKACFDVFVPLDCPATITASPDDASNPNFGFSVVEQQSHLLLFNIKVFCKRKQWSNYAYEQPECLAWTKRAPICLQKSADPDRLLGLILRIKFNQGAFDFRKTEKVFVRLQIECCNSQGHLLNQGTSQYFQLLPRKRATNAITAGEREGMIPVQWQYNCINANSADNVFPANNTNSQSLNDESVLDLFTNAELTHENYDTSTSDCLAISESPNQMQVYSEGDSSEHPPLTYGVNTDEQYMVLYNGNAEVIGNFRALNFYKASDINIKEDIRLLIEDVDPRSVLLKINGVAYKFKNNIKHATNKRFVGYIAQQIESVVPSAVQLIDGILHVDYESLIPYLSEAIKQNFDDIKHANSEQERIKVIVDMLYEDFLTRERKEDHADRVTPRSMSETTRQRKVSPWRKVIVAVVGSVLLMSAILLGLYLLVEQNPHDGAHMTSPLTQVTPSLNTDRRVLQEFFMATNGGSWNFLTHGAIRWFSTAPMCSWYGVFCTKGRVTTLALTSVNMYGTIPESIGDLDALENLNLAINYLHGTLPASIIKLKKLNQIWLDVNPYLTGPIPDLPVTLQLVYLQYCNFTGPIPASIVNMTQVRNFRLDYNQLSGTIPPLPLSENGQTINLSHNRLEGTLPPMSSLSNIVALNVSYNLLSGTLQNLAGVPFGGLYLNDNQFSGEVTYFNTQATRELYIHNNQFTSFNSSVPLPFKKIYCNAANNVFKCPIPDWLSQQCGATCT